MSELKLPGYKWLRAGHPAGFFIWYARISRAKASKLAEQYLKRKPPKVGYEVTLRRVGSNSLNLVNMSGSYELRVI